MSDDLSNSYTSAVNKRQDDDDVAWMRSVSQAKDAERAEPAVPNAPGIAKPAAPTDADIAGMKPMSMGAPDPGKVDTTAAVENAAEAPSGSVPAAATATLKDVGEGLLETPRAVVKGVRDAGQAAWAAVDGVGDWLNANVANLGAVQLFDQKGNFDPGFRQAIPSDGIAGDVNLPDIAAPQSVTGGMVKSTTQFLTGFALAPAIFKGVGIAERLGTGFLNAGARGAVADGLFFEKNDANLSNWIQAHPSVANPVNDFLKSNPDDSEAFGRLKNVVEGLGLGVATEGVLHGIKAVATYRRAKAAEGVLPAPAPRLAPAAQLAQSMGDPRAEAYLHTAQLKAAAEKAPDAVKPDSAAKILLAAGEDASGDALKGVDQQFAAKGLTRVMQDGTGDTYVNFGRIEGPDDVKSVIAQMADAIQNNPSAGKQTFKEIESDAAAMDGWKTLQQRPDAAPLNAAQSLAARNLWYASGQKLFGAAKLAAESPTPENLFAFRRSMAVHATIQGQVLSARTETARALASWKIPMGKGDGSFNMKHIEEAVTAFGGIEDNLEMARKVMDLQRMGRMDVLDKVVEKGAYARGRDAMIEVWRNGLLSSPKTHLVNAIGNGVVLFQNIIERGAAARIGQLLGSEDAPVIGEAMAMTRGVASGLGDAFRYASAQMRGRATEEALGGGANVLATGIESPRFKRAVGADNFGLSDQSWMGKTADFIGHIVNAPSTALRGADDFYQMLGRRVELHAQSFRQATNEVRQGIIKQDQLRTRYAELINDPPDHMVQSAIDSAKYMTFQSQTGVVVKAVNSVRSWAPTTQFILPFVNTPANIFKYTMERTPLAPLMSSFRTAMKKGGADAHVAIARMGLGVSTMAVGHDLFQQGILSAGGPRDKEQRETWLRAGNQPYSIKMGDRWYAYNRIDPLGSMLGLMADTSEYIHHAGDHDGWSNGDILAASTAAIAGNITNKTYFQGFSNVVEVLSDPERYAPQFFQNFGASFVPSISNDIRKIVDPNIRYATSTLDAAKNRIPGLSDSVPAEVDMWGTPKQYGSGLGAAYDFISPIAASRPKEPQPIDTEMQNQGWYIGMPSRVMNLDGERFSFRNHRDIYNRYLAIAGNGVKLPEYGGKTQLEALNSIVDGKSPLSKAYFNLESSSAQEKFIRKVIRKYRTAAKGQLVTEYPAFFHQEQAGQSEIGGDE